MKPVRERGGGHPAGGATTDDDHGTDWRGQSVRMWRFQMNSIGREAYICRKAQSFEYVCMTGNLARSTDAALLGLVSHWPHSDMEPPTGVRCKPSPMIPLYRRRFFFHRGVLNRLPC